jgi:hypothetical protein
VEQDGKLGLSDKYALSWLVFTKTCAQKVERIHACSRGNILEK